MSSVNVNDSAEVLERLARTGLPAAEQAVVTSPGSIAAAMAVKVKSLLAYNFYNVRAVQINEPGTIPTEIGSDMTAVNLAESFLQAGQLAAGTIVVICRVGDKNVFYAKA